MLEMGGTNRGATPAPARVASSHLAADPPTTSRSSSNDTGTLGEVLQPSTPSNHSSNPTRLRVAFQRDGQKPSARISDRAALEQLRSGNFVVSAGPTKHVTSLRPTSRASGCSRRKYCSGGSSSRAPRETFGRSSDNGTQRRAAAPCIQLPPNRAPGAW